MLPRRAWPLLTALGACGSSVTPRDGSLDASAPEAAADATSEVPSVSTCSELHLDAVSANPGGARVLYPGSRLSLAGAGLEAVSDVSVGGVAVRFAHEGAGLTCVAPPLLAAGTAVVTVSAGRCLSSARVTVSRLLAVLRAGSSEATLLDLTELSPQGSLPLGAADVEQARFALEGTSLLLRTSAGEVRRVSLAGAPSATLATGAAGPFLFAQGETLPSAGFLLVPSRSPTRVLLVDTQAGTASPYDSTARDPVGVALSLDGFRAAVLERDGSVLVGDRPLTRTPEWTSLGTPPTAGATEVLLSQAASGPGHLGALFLAGSAPSVVPFDAIQRRVGAAVALPAGTERPRFLSGDVLLFDSATPEVLALDVTDLEGALWRVPLEGEAAGPSTTRTAATLYRVGALALRNGSADTLHLLDFHAEPPAETGRASVPGARGLLGIQGEGDPFVLWTASSVVRVLGATPDAAHTSARALGPGGELTLVVAQP